MNESKSDSEPEKRRQFDGQHHSIRRHAMPRTHRFTSFCASFFFVLFLASVPSLKAANPFPNLASAERRAQFETWLKNSELGTHLKVMKIRAGNHPNPLSSNQVARLELRFIAGNDHQDEEDMRFLRLFRTEHSEWSEKLFYKFIHSFDVGRADASVHIFVLTSEYVIYSQPKTGPMTFETRTKRGTRTVAVLASPALGAQLAGGISLPYVAPGIASNAQEFLLGYFKTLDSKSTILLEPLSDDYVGLRIKNLRNQIIKNGNLWENLQLSIDFKVSPSATVLSCYADGQYAPGLGTATPAEEGFHDFEPKYRAQYQAFVDDVVEKLRKRLSGKNHD
jgi:hypothetical protein